MEATAVRERPILFSAPMVRAILAGTKTQTRRIMKPQSAILSDEMARLLGVRPPVVENQPVVSCPYGIPGDNLWVRETWQRLSNGSESKHHPAYQGTHDVFYRADESDPHSVPMSGRWRPSIFMPRWASRILLEITEVRVQRLQEISEEDAIAEGVDARFEIDMATFVRGRESAIENAINYRTGFKHIWREINGKESWDASPWVWAVSFKRLEPTHA